VPPTASIVTRRRRRGVALALVAIGCGALAAASVHDKVEEVESRTGAPVEVVVAAEEIPPGTRLHRGRVRRVLTVRAVPARYAPRCPFGGAHTSPPRCSAIRGRGRRHRRRSVAASDSSR
jgi:hypothetical protein